MMRFTSILVALVLVSALAFAQTETGQIVGTVTDPQGAVVAGAKVTVKNTNTSAERSTTTSNAGLFTFTNLQPGPYEVTVEAANFAAAKKRIDVSVGSRNVVDFPLTIGQVGTTVEVTEGAGVAVDTTTQELSQTVTSQQITELPTLTRNAYSLVGISGNVSGNSAGRGVGVAINGQRDASTSILLDGGENVDLFTATIGQSTPLDSVGEFRVITSNFSAEYGRASGGIVNVATKSGTNSFHGTVFEFYRGAGLTANTYENNANGVAKPNFVRNQFGYSIGGPVVKDKLFFFNSTEWIRIRSSANLTAMVPDPTYITTNPAIAANTRNFFTTFPLKSGLTVLTNDVSICGTLGCIPWDQISYNVPSNAGGGSPSNEYQTVARVDFNWTDKTTMYGRYALQSQNFFAGTVSDSPYAGFDTGATTFNNNFLYSLTHIWTPNVVTQSKFVFNRLNQLQPINGAPTPTLFMRTRATFLAGTDFAALPGYLPFSPGSGIPFGGPQNLYQFYQDASWTVGKHQFRFGGQYIHTRDNRVFGAYAESAMTLGNTTGSAINGLISGELLLFQGAVDPQGRYPCRTDQFGATIVVPECQITLPVTQPRFDRANRYHDFAFYAQDSWKVHPRFTLNLGVRWEYYGVQHNNDPSFDSNFYLGPGANYFEQVRNGQVFLVTDPNNPVGGLWEKDFDNWAPRIGFAWDLFGDGKTSLRGGYGMAYERNFGNVTFNVIQNPPNYAVLSLVRGVDAACTPSCPITTDNFGPLGGGAGIVNMPKTSLRAPMQDLQTAYSHMWSLAIERELAKNTVLSVEYSGSRGVKLYTIENPNRIGYGPLYLGDNPADQFRPSASCNGVGDCPIRRLNDQYTGFNRRGQSGGSYYHGLNVRVQSNNFMNSGWSWVTNYTWSHAIDNSSSTFSEFGNDFNLGLLNPYDAKTDKGDANFDIRHRWVFSGTWDVPWFKNHDNWFVKNIIGGWTFAPIISAQTGNPFSIWDCTFAFFEVCPRWMPVTPIPTGAHDDVTNIGGNNWSYISINPANSLYFFNPVLGTSEAGNCGVGEGAITGCPYPAEMTGRNAFRAPGLWNVDLGIYKNISITERFKLQFRTEMYNMFNHSNLYVVGSSADFLNELFGDPAVSAKRGGFGNAFDERRNIQLGLKLIF